MCIILNAHFAGPLQLKDLILGREGGREGGKELRLYHLTFALNRHTLIPVLCYIPKSTTFIIRLNTLVDVITVQKVRASGE